MIELMIGLLIGGVVGFGTCAFLMAGDDDDN